MARAHILLIDDNHDVLDAVARGLRSAGYSVATAPDGESGLAMIADARPHLVLCDVTMPGMSGFQFCRRLKQAEGTRGIPVILLSGKVDPADHYWATETGAAALLQKPVDMNQLFKHITQFVRASTTPPEPAARTDEFEVDRG